jgi:hypothetical protein
MAPSIIDPYYNSRIDQDYQLEEKPVYERGTISKKVPGTFY